MSVCLSVCPFVCPSVRTSIRLSVCLYGCPSGGLADGFIVQTHNPEGLCVSSITTGTRRVTRLDELLFVIRLSRRISKSSSSDSSCARLYPRDAKPDEQRIFCRRSSRRVTRLYYKNGQCFICHAMGGWSIIMINT